MGLASPTFPRELFDRKDTDVTEEVVFPEAGDPEPAEVDTDATPTDEEAEVATDPELETEEGDDEVPDEPDDEDEEDEEEDE